MINIGDEIMKNKNFEMLGYTIFVETPRHGAVIDAEIKATEINTAGFSYVNPTKQANYLVAASIKSVKKDNKELITDLDSAIKFVNDLPENAFTALARIYASLVNTDEYETLLKNLGIQVSSRSSRIQ